MLTAFLTSVNGCTDSQIRVLFRLILDLEADIGSAKPVPAEPGPRNHGRCLSSKARAAIWSPGPLDELVGSLDSHVQVQGRGKP